MMRHQNLVHVLFFTNRPDRPCRIAGDGRVFRHVVDNDRARCNDAPRPDANAPHDDAVHPDPRVALDLDWSRRNRRTIGLSSDDGSIVFRALSRVDWMSNIVKYLDAVCDQNASLDIDPDMGRENDIVAHIAVVGDPNMSAPLDTDDASDHRVAPYR